jgi:hypothetical protein
MCVEVPVARGSRDSPRVRLEMLSSRRACTLAGITGRLIVSGFYHPVMEVRQVRLFAAYDRPRRTGHSVGNGIMSRRAEQRERVAPLGEERADPQTLRIIER